jgi:RsiW-degrading membrane proteinase PrsW (M82 family)
LPQIHTSPNRDTGVSGHVRHGVVIGVAFGAGFLAGQDLQQLVGIEAGQRQVEVVALEIRQLDAQHRVVPASVLGNAVVGDHQGSTLGRRQMVEHHHRHHIQTQLVGRRQAAMAGDDHAIAADRIGLVKPNSAIDAAICATC